MVSAQHHTEIASRRKLLRRPAASVYRRVVFVTSLVLPLPPADGTAAYHDPLHGVATNAIGEVLSPLDRLTAADQQNIEGPRGHYRDAGTSANHRNSIEIDGLRDRLKWQRRATGERRFGPAFTKEITLAKAEQQLRCTMQQCALT